MPLDIPGSTDPAFEESVASRIRDERNAVRALLTPAERAPGAPRGADAGRTWEDAAAAVADDPADERRPAVAAHLGAFRDAVNALWLYAENIGATHRLARAWRWARRKPLAGSGVSPTDVGAEATFAMRAQVVGFATRSDTCTRTRLESYARKGLFRALDLMLARAKSPVELPERVARKSVGMERRNPLRAATDAAAEGAGDGDEIGRCGGSD